jgi:hypothetical protein
MCPAPASVPDLICTDVRNLIQSRAKLRIVRFELSPLKNHEGGHFAPPWNRNREKNR